MIQIQVKTIPLVQNDSSIILQNLNSKLAMESFCGKIIVTYESGEIVHVKVEQSFTVDSLVKKLSR